MSTTTSTPIDGRDRALAVAERERNVLIDAGAGTGKTTILIERLIELVAPRCDGPALALDRIAAITFTRRAAGELRLRIRGRLIQALGASDVSTLRRERLRAALSSVDTAYIGTIHSFADRLLRMRPRSARLGPSYEVVDDREALVAETSRLLLHGAARGTLAARVGASLPPGLVVEAARTVRDALEVGLRPVRRESEFWIDHGLDSLVRGFVQHRDVEHAMPDPWQPPARALRAALDELAALGAGAHGGSRAARWLRRIAEQADAMEVEDLGWVFADVAAEIHTRRRGSYKFKKGNDCDGDAEIWRRWNRIDRAAAGGTSLGDDIVAPLHRWMATRLLRLRPVVLALYEDVKARQGVLDEIDLLLLLRNLMRDDLETRGFYQQRFDHVFVDEFQDTDPLQAEILMYLCEREPVARDIGDVVVSPGRITIVGDPQQSIYRFRRADVATYSDVCDRLAADALRLQLTVNFRSAPSLVAWGNARFREQFGQGPDGARFDAARGRVFHRDLDAGRKGEREVSVHVIPLVGEGVLNADACRAAEGRALPQYLRWLVERSGTAIVDPTTDETRAVAWGDICVLAMSTIHLRLLFDELDALAIPYVASGGTLFLDDPMQQRFILALRALADPTDGPAAAALRRPPFFSVDLGQVFRARVDADESGAVAAMEATILELRRRRFERTPGETARALLDQTCLGAAIAVGPSGAQRLSRLREVCHLADMIAFNESLDYDAVTSRMRGWIDDPETIDAPAPVRARAVRVMTIHQAKGLEFPVVALWDARASAESPTNPVAWQVTRDGEQWMIMLDGLRSSHPAGVDLGGVEKALLSEERRRLSYVAVTRARDLLVLPHAGNPSDTLMWRPFSDALATNAVQVLEPYVVGRGAPWADFAMPETSVDLVADAVLEGEMTRAWGHALEVAARPSMRPIAVTSMTHSGRAVALEREPEDVGDVEASRGRAGRYGPGFGTAVHRAIGLVISGELDTAAAATECGTSGGLPLAMIAEMRSDVERVICTLDAHGLGSPAVMRLEYPIAGIGDGGELLVGAIDLLVVHGGDLWVIDFKTDRPPVGNVELELPGYAAQVRLYADLLRRAGVGDGLVLRCALLFTADGSLHEVGAILVKLDAGDAVG